MAELRRNHFLDIAKGLAIFLMLWGHCIQYCVAYSDIDFFENIVFKAIYSFHMPLFMLISGYLFFYSFIKRGFKELLVYKTQALIQPIVFCTLLNCIITTLLIDDTPGILDNIFDGSWLNSITSLWFLWSILAASLAMAVAGKVHNNILVQILVLIAFVPIISLLPNADMILFMYPYFIVGFYFAKFKEKLMPIANKLKYLSLPAFPILICFFEKKHYIYTTGLFFDRSCSFVDMIPIHAFRLLIGFVGSFFVLTILRMIYQLIAVYWQKAYLFRGLSILGKYSLQIYTLSVAVLSTGLSFYFPKALSLLHLENIFAQNIYIYNFAFTPLLAVVFATILCLIARLFDKIKISNLLYKK